MLEPWVARSASLPAVRPVYLSANVGPRGATRCSACPVLRHSESGPLSLSARMWGRRVCQWSDCLPRSSHTLPVSVPPWQRESSPPGCPSPPLLPVWMNVCFFFLGVRPPCRLILCQFWLCEEAQCVYLHRHLGSLHISLNNSVCCCCFGFDTKNKEKKGKSKQFWGHPERGCPKLLLLTMLDQTPWHQQ